MTNKLGIVFSLLLKMLGSKFRVMCMLGTTSERIIPKNFFT